MCVPFQQQFGHSNLPILSRHMERGKSFLRRNTGRQNGVGGARKLSLQRARAHTLTGMETQST